MILTPYPPVVLRDQPSRLCSGTLRALRCVAHHLPSGFSVLRPRAQISERKRGADHLPVRLRRLPRRPAARIEPVIEPAFEPEGPEGGYDLGRGVTEGQVVFVEQRMDGELAG